MTVVVAEAQTLGGSSASGGNLVGPSWGNAAGSSGGNSAGRQQLEETAAGQPRESSGD